ncbi:bifunctional adenosylcobinamide kinase/adenosylcobinamide-phosphate guanylyltransferase [Niallia sp. NCCP-28]|uniref:bifunctional adenosylcobinamide kinase/adenosylcobinamide-phosphate guanylyltransferase n=1 Tax=Niallia sp. NCCP-28 TaxID=2934712 RepID=UPI0020811693|nr:bifunctional adenosylcobinamide kinase/adenosylcobinamide-phosphate guanylyltransferase [Niallia sp. NCCP-28]GKU84661.1 adenosylcobinamide kinase/adenosylcobinamide phosphate guanyltransferase [Niallia sp. NCCP-28]
MDENSTLIFITGGVRSGKTSFAEQLAAQFAEKEDLQLHYLATGVVTDAEMQKRVEHHQEIRANYQRQWKTVEQEANLHTLQQRFCKKDVVLFDCLTTLVSNELFLKEQAHWSKSFLESLKQEIVTAVILLSRKCKYFIIVSNEVSYEPMQTPLLIAYSWLLGNLHQTFVEIATEAYLVENGLVIKKG